MVGIEPCSRTIRSGSMRSTCPSRTTFSMRRSCSSSRTLTVPPFIMVGTTARSMRSITSSSSRRSNTSSTDSDATIASSCRTTPSNVRDCPGWKNARLRIHESRGRIQVMSSGSRTSIEQPTDGIQRGLAPADDHVPGGRVRRAWSARRPGRSGPRRPRRTAQDRLPAHATPCRSRRRRGCEPSRPSPDPVTRERKRRSPR